MNSMSPEDTSLNWWMIATASLISLLLIVAIILIVRKKKNAKEGGKVEMKNTSHKVIIAIIIGLLSVQTFFPSLSRLLLPEIHAIDHTIEPLDETQNMSLLDKATQPIQTKEFDIHPPFFQFPVKVIEGVVDKLIQCFRCIKPTVK